MRTLAAILLFACAVAPAFGQSREFSGGLGRTRTSPPTDQVIVKWRQDALPATAAKSSAAIEKLGSRAGMRLQRKRQIALDTDVLQLDHALDANELSTVLAQMAADPQVEFAVADQHRWAHALPTDPLVGEQWYFLGNEAAATHADRAWDITPGSNATVVAVLDTGVRFEHPDLGRFDQGGKLLAGFDFVSQVAIANDGDGVDSDPADPGDWIDATDKQQPAFSSSNCEQHDSSWHGTRVSSLIAALTNNALGMAGTGWDTLILPVRVLGKCGGTDSDIIAGMRWAAGIAVPGAPLNTNPAQIINLSLGGTGACSPAYQAAISEITASGVLVVASVGNEGGPVGVPANCAGVLSVTGLRHAGTKVGFSNLGPGVSISAPAGNCVNLVITNDTPCLFSIIAATNTGTTTPGASSYTDRVLHLNFGTSFSAPLVAGAAALVHSVNSQLSPAQYITVLRESATAFPTTSTTTTNVCHVPTGSADLQNTECICTTQTCGAGMLNTHAAVLAAQRPFAVAQAPSTIAAGTDVTIDARSSFASNNRTIISYQWSAVGVTGVTPAFVDPAQAFTTLQVSGASAFTLRLTVTDDQGAQDTADVVMATPPDPPPTPVQPARSGGGGGGSLGWLMLAVLMLAFAGRNSLLVRRNSLQRQEPG